MSTEITKVSLEDAIVNVMNQDVANSFVGKKAISSLVTEKLGLFVTSQAWSAAIKSLLAQGKVVREGAKKGAKYKLVVNTTQVE